MKNLPKVMFITGIGTDVGKSYSTGWLARELAAAGKRVITQKFIQTGNRDYSEDIDVHRRIMGMPMQQADLDHTTAPLILSYPASPDLAARIDGVELDFSVATRATQKLSALYDHVLIEGAGGIMVPLHDEYLTIDYVAEQNIPTVVVTNGQLGSINHTLLTLMALEQRGITVSALIYNPFFDQDNTICEDTQAYLRRYLERHHAGAQYLEMPAELYPRRGACW